MMVSDWQNPLYSLDIDDDGSVSPLDVLINVNRLNAGLGGAFSDNMAQPIPSMIQTAIKLYRH